MLIRGWIQESGMSWDRSYTRKVISVRCASTYISVLLYLWVLVGVLEVMFLWLDLGNDSGYPLDFFHWEATFLLHFFHGQFIFKSCIFSRQAVAFFAWEIIKSWEKKKKLKSSSSPLKIKHKYIKCMHFESSKQILLLCLHVLSRLSVSYSYYPTSRKPCLQRLFLTLACHWAWGWAKSCWMYREVWIFLFSL